MSRPRKMLDQKPRVHVRPVIAQIGNASPAVSKLGSRVVGHSLGGLHSFASSRRPLSETHAGPAAIFVDKFDPVDLKGRLDFPCGSLASTQFPVRRLKPRDCRF